MVQECAGKISKGKELKHTTNINSLNSPTILYLIAYQSLKVDNKFLGYTIYYT